MSRKDSIVPFLPTLAFHRLTRGAIAHEDEFWRRNGGWELCEENGVGGEEKGEVFFP